MGTYGCDDTSFLRGGVGGGEVPHVYCAKSSLL